MIFADRNDAGRQLAERLAGYKKENPVVLAIPRGGVVVAGEIAKALDAPLTLIIPRKIGAPYDPEFAIGAVAEDGSMVLDEDTVSSLGVSPEYIEAEKKAQIEEIKRRKQAYGAVDIELKGRVVILVDDGIATGSTVIAAVKSIRKKDPKKIVVAVPVAPQEAVSELKNQVEEVVCLHAPEYFGAVGCFYRDFSQTSDAEVMSILREK